MVVVPVADDHQMGMQPTTLELTMASMSMQKSAEKGHNVGAELTECGHDSLLRLKSGQPSVPVGQLLTVGKQ